MKVIACGESKMGEMMMRTVGMALVFGCETKGDALSEYFSHVKTGQVERDGEKEFISLDSSCFFVRESTQSYVFIFFVCAIGILTKLEYPND